MAEAPLTLVCTFTYKIKNFKWFEALPTGGLQELECGCCYKQLGNRKWASAWIEDGQGSRGARLCFDCASKVTNVK